jgi:hypothetical protein
MVTLRAKFCHITLTTRDSQGNVSEKVAEAEGGFELAWRGELDGVKAHALTGADVGEDVVNVKDSGRRDACRVDSGLVDLWLWLAGSYATGIDAPGEVTEEREMGQHEFDVKGIRVGHED